MDTSVEPSGVGVETTTDTPPPTTDGTATPGSKRKRAHEVRDPNAPKRPSTAYIFFSTEMRPKIRDDYPDLTLSERSKLMGKLWANLEQGKKQPFLDMAEQDKERYIRDYVAYQETDSYKEFMRKKYPGLSKRPRLEKPDEPEETTPTPSARVQTGKRPLSCQQQYVPGSNTPIFSEQFLEHNREMEVQLRKLRQSNSSLEEESALLSRHVENMKSSVEKIQNEVTKQQTRNDSLKDNLSSLREVLASTFKDVAIPDTNETPTVENIDSYMGKLQVAIASEPDKHPELVDRVTEIAKQLELYLLQRFSPHQQASAGQTPLEIPIIEATPTVSRDVKTTPMVTHADEATPTNLDPKATPIPDEVSLTELPCETTPTADQATAISKETTDTPAAAETTPTDHTPPVATETTVSGNAENSASEQQSSESEKPTEEKSVEQVSLQGGGEGVSGERVSSEGVIGEEEEEVIVDDEQAVRAEGT